MKKIDLHIHTRTSSQDKSFNFSMDKLKQYVADAEIDCIAITNHNLFDRSQFEEISQGLEILTLPGIEVDVENFHILAIHNNNDLDKFEKFATTVNESWSKHSIPMRYDDFIAALGKPSDYLLIPHYQKSPQIGPEYLEKFGSNVFCGEVSSPKKFISCLKDKIALVPLFFSDCRISDDLRILPTKQTYIDCGELSFGALKETLRDRHKVFLSQREGNNLFEIFPDGQKISSGLNVILGDRSSGKSHTLKMIHNWLGEETTGYIKQFDLVARNEAEDEKKFKDFLVENTSRFSRDYLVSLQAVVDEIVDIDTASDLDAVEKYLNSLSEHANETSKQDIFSKAKLYTEDSFQIKNMEGLIQLIQSTKHLYRNAEYREIIDKHIPSGSLKALYVELMKAYGSEENDSEKKKWINSLVTDIKAKLQRKSSATAIKDINLFNVALNRRRVSSFKRLVEAARSPKTPLKRKIRGFEIVAQSGPFPGAGELKALSRSAKSFSLAFSKYDDPYDYINELKKIGDPVSPTDYAKYLVKLEYKILNRFGHEASGGERSEFFLLEKIESATTSDALLIDEPESSLDNNFLRSEVNELIKELSQKMPVVIVTHNNTVGASIKPDYLLYTKKEVNGIDVGWTIYSGAPTDKTLKSTDGRETRTLDVLLGNLEAGAAAYNERNTTYENLKN